MYNPNRTSFSHHSSHLVKKPCCARNEMLFQGGNGTVFKNSYAADVDDDDNFTITSNPFIDSQKNYNSETEGEYEFSKYT